MDEGAVEEMKDIPGGRWRRGGGGLAGLVQAAGTWTVSARFAERVHLVRTARMNGVCIATIYSYVRYPTQGDIYLWQNTAGACLTLV